MHVINISYLQLKKYIDQLETAQKAEEATKVTNLLYNEWNKKQIVDAYDLGLALIDLYINQVGPCNHYCLLKLFPPLHHMYFL